jgi:hypothetical protein
MMEVLPPGSGRLPLLASNPRRRPSRTRSERRRRGWTLRGIGGGPDIGLAEVLLGLGIAGLVATALAAGGLASTLLAGLSAASLLVGVDLAVHGRKSTAG